MAAGARDAGLVRRIGAFGLAASIVNVVVGAAIFTLPAEIAHLAGGAAPFAYLLAALVMAGITLAFAEAGSRVPTSGGAYGTVEAAFGPLPGFVCGSLLILSDLLASAGIAAALATLAGFDAAHPAARAGFILAVYAVLVLANLIPVAGTARLIAVATLVKLLPLLLFVVLAVPHLAHPAPGFAAPPAQLDFGRALILCLFVFEGMETAIGASGEVRDPARTLPIALLGAMGFVLLLYLGLQLGASALLGGALGHSAAPLADAAARIGAPLRAIMLGGGFLSMFVWLGSDILGTSRMVFALARDGRLPGWLGRLTAQHVPAAAVLAYTATAALVAVSGSFLELVLLSSLATMVIYALVCLAAIRLRRNGTELAGPPLRLALLTPGALLGLAGMVALLAVARPAEQLGIAGAIAGACLLYTLTGARHSPK